jgi:hypothetical protein
MAGLGYKQWVAGEQLTAANFQSYFQDQTVMVFASSAARGSALTGVVSEGMVSYLQDVNALQVYNGSSWGAVTPDVPTASPGTAGIVFGRTFGSADSSYTVALGHSAGGSARANASYIGNTGIGVNAGASLTTGYGNTLIGGETGFAFTTGVGNTFTGVSAGFLQSTGSYNAGLGFASGYSFYGATDNCTFLGASAGGSAGPYSHTGTNLTLVGFQAMPSGTAVSNQITLGNGSVNSLRCAVTSISSLSDERDKADIAPLEYGLDFVNELEPVSFTWDTRDESKVGELDFGFIAQHLAEVEDRYEADRLKLTLRDNEDKLEATPGRLIPILVKAIQELSSQVEELKNARCQCS